PGGEGPGRAGRLAAADPGRPVAGHRAGDQGAGEARRHRARAGARAGGGVVPGGDRGAGGPPMIDVDVRDLLAHPGTSRRYRLEEPVPGLGIELVRVPDDAPVEADLLLESVVEGVLVSGPLSGPLTLTCARCLKELDG